MTLRASVRGTGGPRALLVSAVASIALAGCATMSPVQTDRSYDAGDGVPVSTAQVEIRNLVVVSEAAGKAGSLTGQVVNKSDEAVNVTFETTDGAQAVVDVAAHGQLSLSADGDLVTIDPVSAPPGAMLDLSVTTTGDGPASVKVPVLAPTGYYAPYAPA